MITVSNNKAYYTLFAILFICAAVLLLFIILPSPTDPLSRKPNSLEKTYTALVTHGFSSNLCEKISPKALSSTIFNSSGSQIYYERSACYFYVAAAELNDAYCPLVVEAKAFLRDGSQFSPEGCREIVSEGRPWRATVGIANHEELLRAAGYNGENLTEAVPGAEPDMAWMELYYSLKKNSGGQLQQSFNQLPDFSSE